MKISPLFRRNDELSMPSMADIAFLLIIFFMLTTVMTIRKGMDLQVGQEDEAVTVPQKSIEIVILEDERLSCDEQIMGLSELRDYVKQNVTLNPQKFVIIKAHDTVTFQRLIDVLDELKGAYVKNIAFQDISDT